MFKTEIQLQAERDFTTRTLTQIQTILTRKTPMYDGDHLLGYTND